MSEADAVARTENAPRTRESLAADVRALGLRPGRIVLVHASLSALGWVCGGPVAVVQALLDVVGPQGTLVMPAFSGDYCDPAGWENPPVPPAWWPTIRETMPAFEPHLAPTRGMGRIAETFRTWPGALRSAHPAVSFAALGPEAQTIVGGHALDYPLGETSPLARVYERNGHVLLLGVGYDRNTSFHLAEFRAGRWREHEQGAPLIEAGRRVWKTYKDVDATIEVSPNIWTNPLTAIGADFEATGGAHIGRVGSAPTRLFRQQSAVNFAVGWLRAYPEPPASPPDEA